VSDEIAVDSASAQSVTMRNAFARISGRQSATSTNATTSQDQSGTPRRTPMAELRTDLISNLLKDMAEDRNCCVVDTMQPLIVVTQSVVAYACVMNRD
jgi:hypothetical protein